MYIILTKQIEYSLYGILFGLVYILLIFGPIIKAGKPHNLNIDLPLLCIKSGMLIINNYHIHHWFLFILILLFTYFYKENEIIYFLRGFCLTWIIHGLLYEDCFDFEEFKLSIKKK